MKAVIFDMDGVISDTQTLHAGIEAELFKGYGIDIASEEISEKYSGMSDEEFFKTVFDKFGRSETGIDLKRVIEEKWEMVFTCARNNIPAIDGAIDIIKKLKDADFKLGVASASKKEFIGIVLSELNITEYFDAITSAYEVENGKPSPDIFLLTAKKLGVSPNECTVIEDGKLGMVAAKKAGMRCIGLVNKNTVDKSKYEADKIVKSLKDLRLTDFQ